MRKSLVLIASAMMVSALTFVSCKKDVPLSYPPEYEKPLRFTLEDAENVTWENQNQLVQNSVSSCNAGDSVTVFLPTTYTGSYIYKATYKWVLEVQGGDVIDRKTFVQVSPCELTNLPPKWTFEAPKAGTYNVYFRAIYNYSASTENGAISGGYPTSSGLHGYEDKSSVSGILRVK